MTQSSDTWDAIVIGSGMGGLSCAAALARMGQKVLVVEQHYVAGGLTQTFFRGGFRWDVGVHYLGEMGPGGEARAILDWLSGGAIEFASMGDVYDILHFPGGFELQVARTQDAYQAELKKHFPNSAAEIDAYFGALAEADGATRAIFAGRAMPRPLAGIYRFWRGREIGRWWGRASAEVLRETISDPKLRAVLSAQRANYGGMDLSATSFGLQALITRHYFNGAYYPVGGAKVFAEKLVPVIEQAGGAIRLKAKVCELLVEKGAVLGVRLEDGEEIRAPKTFSDAGARNSVAMLPEELRKSEWAHAILSFAPSPCHVALYLGFEGDIAAHGATSANHWFHETWDMDAGLWRDPSGETTSPGVFVSFPTLKDPAHVEGAKRRHTGEIVAMVDWASFVRWRNSSRNDRPQDYKTFKEAIERNLMAQFARYFPALAPMATAQELSTPLSTVAFTGAPQGAIYGIEVSPRRFLSDSLRPRTPIPGLFLTGQDVVTPGVTGAMMGGVLAAAAVEPRILPHIH